MATKTNKKLPAIHSATGEKFIPVGQYSDSLSVWHSRGIVSKCTCFHSTMVMPTQQPRLPSLGPADYSPVDYQVWHMLQKLFTIPWPTVSCQRVASLQPPNPASCWQEMYFANPDFKESTLTVMIQICESQKLCKEDYIIYDN